jgi:hypothetical protein
MTERFTQAPPAKHAFERETPPGLPRWLKLLGLAVLILALVFAGLHLTGHGEGPGSHSSGAEHGMTLP